MAIMITGTWILHLAWSLWQVEVAWDNPWMYAHILIQAYLYTGLFITGHDAMHGSVSSRTRINRMVGHLSAWLFACLSYKKLHRNHFDHHRFPATDKDPDYCARSQNFFVWWAHFMYRYVTFWQIICMAIIFNLARYLLHLPVSSLLVLWILPAFLGTFQLFYFGTFVPHRQPHEETMGIHRARTLRVNHIWAMLSCYFFGYHREHHESPGTPWWKLWQSKG